MPSLLSGLFGLVQGRILHVPEADVAEVLDSVNGMRPGRAPLDESDLRAFESAQALYTAGRLIRQVTPHQAAPLVAVAANAELRAPSLAIVDAVGTPVVPDAHKPFGQGGLPVVPPTEAA